MVYFTGDIHGNVIQLLWWLEKCRIPHEPSQIIVLLGDTGINYFCNYLDREKKVLLQDSKRTYFCIHGNHERRPASINNYIEGNWHGGKVYREKDFPNLIFAKDGEVFDLDGVRTLVLGGAYSIDKQERLKYGLHWFEDEQISESQRATIFKKIKQLGSVDLVLSHTCPLEWQPTDLFISGIDQNLVDNSMERWLTKVERSVNYRYWLFAHYHDDRKINDKAQMLYKNIIDFDFLKEG